MATALFRISFLLTLLTVHGSLYAESAQEHVRLTSIQQQVDNIERIAAQAQAANTPEPIERYRFDYPRLSHDIQRIRQGVQDYLSPSRAQPRDPGELAGDYRLDSPPPEPSP
ncbi:RAQPRD family integrative conjugative element protein [Pseudomonas sp. WP18]|uniref:integrative conjugative element protein, RAQPRD family n=1 Tax=Pseudomonas sp. WP18 TaxID=3118752 RepID=UPI0030CAD737